MEEAQRLKEEILARFRCVEVYIEPVTPVLGVHAGPGALGLAYYVEQRGFRLVHPSASPSPSACPTVAQDLSCSAGFIL